MIFAFAAAGAPWIVASGITIYLYQACLVLCVGLSGLGNITGRLSAALGLLAFAGILLLTVAVMACVRACRCCAKPTGEACGNVKAQQIASAVLAGLAWIFIVAGAALPPNTTLAVPGGSFIPGLPSSGISSTVSELVSNSNGLVKWGPAFGLSVVAALFTSVILVLAIIEAVLGSRAPTPLSGSAGLPGGAAVMVMSPMGNVPQAVVVSTGSSKPGNAGASTKPPKLPAGWRMEQDETDTWYVNNITGESTWDLPTLPATA